MCAGVRARPGDDEVRLRDSQQDPVRLDRTGLVDRLPVAVAVERSV
jgi:hypothetical protein